MSRLNSRNGKLAPLYEGPYTVVRKNKGGSYELKDEQNELMHRNYTPSELKIVHIDESNIEDEYRLRFADETFARKLDKIIGVT
ncbi:hypothetical protein G6F29_013345 [Rhizopus arrhizus]|nr:hypothetical protein G6F24_016043 [Rhizopus arrhizus]KAG0774222.1 hypothetical protein G6F22_014239 [Rhizopus arrhizus]KAG0811710.1 hypothetical protein G6F19_013404 [Rhizopus arrhizus]KAG0846592.1 hypothetical protein G6F17_013304 [Rhizopus arrhizus]KAG0853898.1 hypothetical protein G6F16_013770 [Rhizopus arrhizus]